MSNLDIIAGELIKEGYTAVRITSPHHGQVVAIKYRIPTGKHQGKEVSLGFSFHGDELYPEYPPHWIHISPPHDDGRGGAIQAYTTPGNGMEEHWLALSRPPTDFWDKIPNKGMQAYLKMHITRFCGDLQ